MNEANVLFFARAIICLSPVFPQFFPSFSNVNQGKQWN
jgi:hypothetical protein